MHLEPLDWQHETNCQRFIKSSHHSNNEFQPSGPLLIVSSQVDI